VAWKVEFDYNAAKEFKKLDKQNQILISGYLKNKISPIDNPRNFGKPLRYEFSGLWRYRVRNFRIICSIEEDTLIILVLKIDTRDSVYT
jgi:mRNA interferase RelE/StbE